MVVVTNTEGKKETIAPALKYRYACYGCTGVAFKSSNNMVGNSIICQRCGKEQITVAENYILL